jgi:hypothetical protein
MTTMETMRTATVEVQELNKRTSYAVRRSAYGSFLGWLSVTTVGSGRNQMSIRVRRRFKVILYGKGNRDLNSVENSSVCVRSEFAFFGFVVVSDFTEKNNTKTTCFVFYRTWSFTTALWSRLLYFSSMAL